MTHEEFQARYKYDYSVDLLGEGGFGAEDCRLLIALYELLSKFM